MKVSHSDPEIRFSDEVLNDMDYLSSCIKTKFKGTFQDNANSRSPLKRLIGYAAVICTIVVLINIIIYIAAFIRLSLI